MKKRILYILMVAWVLLGSLCMPTEAVAAVGDKFGEYTITHVLPTGDISIAGTEQVYEVTGGTGIITVNSGSVVFVLNGTDRSGTYSQFLIKGTANVTLYLAEGKVNTFKSTGGQMFVDAYQAGIYVAQSATLTIKGPGTLNAIGGKYSAGIGGIYVSATSPSGTIIIESGTINATGGDSGAGIGGGYSSAGGTTIIQGGTVNATGGNNAAGIGGGYSGAGGIITIESGTVIATGGSSAAGIGGGYSSAGGTIKIHGGDITAKGGTGAGASYSGSGAGIGGGGHGTINQNNSCKSGNILITGGNITARAYYKSAAIGGGYQSGVDKIEITGGNIDAQAMNDGTGIGAGATFNCGIINISGGTIFAKGAGGGTGIGNPTGVTGGEVNIFGGSVFSQSLNGNISISPDPKNSHTYDYRPVYFVGIRLVNESNITIPNAEISINITHPSNPLYNYNYTASSNSNGIAYLWLPEGTFNCLFYIQEKDLYITDVITVNIPSDPSQYDPNDIKDISLITTFTPTITISANVEFPMCANTYVTFAAYAEGGGNNPQYQWKKGNENVGTGDTYSYTPASGDIITCTLTSNHPGADPKVVISNEIIVEIVPLSQVAEIELRDTLICVGTTLNLNDLVISSNVNSSLYNWCEPSLASTYIDPNISPDEGIYTYYLNASGYTICDGIGKYKEVTVTVNPISSIDYIFTRDTTISKGSEIELNDLVSSSSQVLNPEYIWYDALDANVPMSTTKLFPSMGSHFYYVAVKGDNYCEGGEDTRNKVLVRVNQTGNPLDGDEIEICVGATVTLKAYPSNGGETPAYKWKKDNIYIDGATNSTYSFTPQSSCIVTCEMTSNAYCVEPKTVTSLSVTIIVNPSPAAPEMIPGAETTVCKGEVINIMLLESLIVYPAEVTLSFWTNSDCTVPFMDINTDDSEELSHTIYVTAEDTKTGCTSFPNNILEILIEVGCAEISGTVFPFIYYNEPMFDTLFPVLARLYDAELLLEGPETILLSEPLHIDTARYYEGTKFVPNTPKYPGFLGRLENPGVDINWEALEFTRGTVDDTPLLKGEKPQLPIGLYRFNNVKKGDYVLVLSRAGYVTRFAKITVGNDSEFLEHRELIPGDVSNDLMVDVSDLSTLNSMFSNFGDPKYDPKYDLNGDLKIDMADLSIIKVYLQFHFGIYEDTADCFVGVKSFIKLIENINKNKSTY